MTTTTEIANAALARNRISVVLVNVSTDTNSAAVQCRLMFPYAIQALEEAFTWPEYVAREKLTETIEQPDDGAYYAYPQGAARVCKIEVGSPTPEVWYQRHIEPNTFLPRYLVAPLTALLAAQITSPTTSDNNLQQQLAQEADLALAKARRFANGDNFPVSAHEGDRPMELRWRVEALSDGGTAIFVPDEQHFVGDYA